MSQATLLELFDEYASEITRRQDESWQSPSPEAFHQLRVYIKRMRALLGLVEELSGNAIVRRRGRVFRPLFKSAGNVRDLHVQIDLVKGVEEKRRLTVDWYRAAIEGRERDAIQDFLRRHDALLSPSEIGSVRQAVKRALSTRNEIELAAAAWHHFENRLANAVAFDVETKDLHDLRKRIKETSNLTWILERAFPEVALDQTLKTQLDDLQSQLGRWHDFDVAAAWADNVPPGEVPEEGRDDWQPFRQALHHRRGVLRAKVIRRWRQLESMRATGS